MSKSAEHQIATNDYWLDQIATMSMRNFKVKYPDTNEVLAKLNEADKRDFLLKIFFNENLAAEFLGLKHSPNISLNLWEELYQDVYGIKSSFFSAYWTQKLLKEKHDAYCFIEEGKLANEAKENIIFSIQDLLWNLVEPLLTFIELTPFSPTPQSSLIIDFPDQETTGNITPEETE